MDNKKIPIIPVFDSTIIDHDRTDGYWVETFHFSTKDAVPGVITSGLNSGTIEFLDNPIAAHGKGGKVQDKWEKYEIAKFDSPVAVAVVDINGNGLTDVIVSHDYGPYMLQPNPDGGWVTWLENPGRDKLKNGHWKQRTIGRWPTMHRMKAGYFTQQSFLELIGAPIVHGGVDDKTTPVPIILFQAPEKVLEAAEWPRYIIDDENFTIIHEITKRKLKVPSPLDSLLVASREGLTSLYYEGSSWKKELISVGEPKEPQQSYTAVTPGSGDHWGTGGSDAGSLAGQSLSYIATLDPFHGISVCVYTRVDTGLGKVEWKKHVLDTYGTPTQRQKWGDGPLHFVVCADIDGDGDDEFLVSLMGPLNRDDDLNTIQTSPGPHPYKGIMCYKVIDVDKGLFAKWRVADESSARIAVGDFAGKGKVDIVSLSYNVHKYYEEPEPVVTLHLNKTPRPAFGITATAIIPTVWDNEGLMYLALPGSVTSSQSFPLIEIANYALTVEVHPPGAKIPVDTGEGVKVLYGTVADINGARTALGVRPFPTLAPTTSDDSNLSADAQHGAILIRLSPINDAKTADWSSAADVPVRTTFRAKELGLHLRPLHFKKVEDLWWGEKFKGVDFYNLSGFHFRFQHDKSVIAHLQFWTAGKNVNCGVHNHSDDIFQEIHISLSPGTGKGGMSRIKKEFEDTPPSKIGDLDDSAFETVPLPELYEHGGLWYRDSYDKPVRGQYDVVSYPWHKWQAGSGDNVDVWLALEFNPDLPQHEATVDIR